MLAIYTIARVIFTAKRNVNIALLVQKCTVLAVILMACLPITARFIAAIKTGFQWRTIQAVVVEAEEAQTPAAVIITSTASAKRSAIGAVPVSITIQIAAATCR